MMCERCNCQLSAYLDGRLNSAENQRIAVHLGACLRCREDLRELRAMRSLLCRLSPPEPRPGFVDEALRLVRTQKPRARRRLTYRYAAGAATVLVLLTLLAVANQPEPALAPMAITPARELTISPASLITLHTRERARSPLVDLGKVRAAGSEAEIVDLVDNGRFDVQ